MFKKKNNVNSMIAMCIYLFYNCGSGFVDKWIFMQEVYVDVGELHALS